jgi:hypothetical protein
LVEIFEAKEVSFVAITQQFNTTTSMGRLTLNVLLSFAQFERELASERVRDKLAASRQKGKWTGGSVPLGYDITLEWSQLWQVTRTLSSPMASKTNVALSDFNSVSFLNRHGVRTLRRRLREQTETPTPEQIAIHNRKTLGDDFSEEAWERRKARGRARNEAEKLASERDHPGQRFPEHGCNLTPREATDLARWPRQRAKANKLKRAEVRLARWRRRQPKEMKRAQAHDRAY